MKKSSFPLLALLALVPAALSAQKTAADRNCDCGCCAGQATCCCHTDTPEKKPDETKRHPLKGVIVSVLPAQAALLVRHEPIPGFMPAMTMMFRVDDATLKAAAKDLAITATLVQRGDEFWLEDMQPADRRK